MFVYYNPAHSSVCVYFKRVRDSGSWGWSFFFFFFCVGGGPQGDRHNRRREAGGDPSRPAGGHRQFSEEVQTGSLLREALWHRGCGESICRGRHAGEKSIFQVFSVIDSHASVTEVKKYLEGKGFVNNTLALCVVSGECWHPGTWSQPCSVSPCWRSWGWTQTIALEPQSHKHTILIDQNYRIADYFLFFYFF